MTRWTLLGVLAIASVVAGPGAGAQGVVQQGDLAPKAANGIAPPPKPIPATLTLPEDRLEYNWLTASWTRYRTVRAGQTVTVVITNINRLCYNFTFADRQIAAKEETAAFLTLLNANETALQALAKELYEPKAAPAPDGKKADGKTPAAPAAVHGALFNAPKANPLDDPRFDEAKKILGEAESYARSAFAALGTAGTILKAQIAAGEAARKSLAAFYDGACPGGDIRGVTNAGALWAAATPGIDAFVSGIGAAIAQAEKSIASSRDEAKIADARLVELRRRSGEPDIRDFLAFPVVLDRLRGVVTQLEGYAIVADKQTEPIKPLRQDAGVLGAALKAIPTQLSATTYVKMIPVWPESESLNIITTASGKSDISNVKSSKIEDVQDIPTYRRNRAFMSAGFMFSSLEEHDFQRANLIGSDGKPYSTFVDKKSNRNMAFSPTILTHMTLGDYRGVGFAGSAGLGARTVGGRLSPDFVLGGSTMIRDLAVLTLAWHRGRIERLLIGDAGTIRKSAVDSSVTREGAVGETWGDALALIFSVRVN